MSVLVSKDILSQIFHYLPVQQAKDCALLGDTFYRASRLGSAMNMRWKVFDTKRLNDLLSRFFVHLIDAVEVSDLMVLTCFYYARVNITSVKLHINKDDLKLSKSDFINFNQLTELNFVIVAPIDNFYLIDLPEKLKVLKFNRLSNDDKNEDQIHIPSKLPTTLEILYIRYLVVKNIILPDGLKELTYIDKDCFTNMPKVIPKNILTLNIQGKSTNAWEILQDDVIYQNLQNVTLCDENVTTQISILTSSMPNIKNIQATHLKLTNDGQVTIEEFGHLPGHVDYVNFGEKNKRIKL